MFFHARMPSRFVGIEPGEYLVVGLSFRDKEEADEPTGYQTMNMKFRVANSIEKPIDIVSFLHVSEQRWLN
jgi:hypothetical protein